VSITSASGRGELRNAYRFGMFVLAIAFGVTALTARMFYLQVVQSQPANNATSNSQPTELESIPAPRGLIYDASGKPLVQNIVDFSVTVTPVDLPRGQEETVAQRLGSILNLDPIYIETQIDGTTGSLYVPVKIADGVSASIAGFIDENSDALPGVKISQTQKREYLTGQLFSDVLGYEGRITETQYQQLKSQGYSDQDIVGQAGLEGYYETELRGTPGNQTVALDAQGEPIPDLVTHGKNPISGDSLTLNIDTHEQQLAAAALAWGVRAAKVKQGVIIVENPQNGQILAMVSLPTYNDQLFADGISGSDFQALLTDPNQPLINKAIGGQYAPGSTYKLVTATAGLQDGSINTTQTLVSQPYIQVGEFKYWEWDRHGWGPLNIYQGFSYSSDTFFYQLATEVGLKDLTYWGDQYGFGKPTGIDLPETATGIVPTNAWKMATQNDPMYTGEIMYAGIGQGYDSVTPMQLLNAYSALANGGNVWQPQIVKSITDGATGAVTQVQPVLMNKLPASASTLETIRVAARQVVTSRHTGDLTDIPDIKIAGKTGTAEFGVLDQRGRLPYHEWFVGFTPADPYVDDFTKPDSQLAVIAFIYGANTWGNVATEVVKTYMLLHYKVISRQALALDRRTPGYIMGWVYRTTNFYGNNSRD
jgi:penicillin-binding protein 2